MPDGRIVLLPICVTVHRGVEARPFPPETSAELGERDPALPITGL